MEKEKLVCGRGSKIASGRLYFPGDKMKVTDSNTVKVTKKPDTKTMAALGMLSAVAFLAACFLKVQVFSFLSLEPKDTVLAITGFLFGPAAALITSVLVSLAEFLFISSTGWIGLIMNVISSAAFSVTASLLYKRVRTFKGALTGLVTGTLLMTALMLVWNYLITPLYMDTTREYVASLLPTVFLPFNLVKGALNTALTLLLYKPLVRSLKTAHLLPVTHADRGTRNTRSTLWGIAVACVLLALSLFFIFKWRSA